MKLFVLTLFIFVVCCQASNQCASLVDGYFYQSPQAPGETFSACRSYENLSCCAANYTNKISSHGDPVGKAFFANVFKDSASANCVDLVTAVECMPCSPSQQDWITLHSYGNDLQLCLSFCQQLFSACAQATYLPTSRTVQSTFISADDFCHSVFNSNNITVSVRTPDNTYCWDDFPECTEDDYFELFTECTENQTRSIYYYWKPSSHCKGGVSLPEPITGLPCAISCNEGEFLKPGTTTCLTCPAGTYSMGGGERIESWTGSWGDFDPPFRTYCSVIQNGDLIPYTSPEGETPCGWQLNGPLTTSGSLGDSMVSSLELQVVMVRDGTLRFTFMVDSEAKWDGLVLYIDSVETMKKVSNQNYFKEVSFALSKGFHHIVWAYEKDASISVGDDRAYIQMIEIDGIRYADSKCTTCIPGQYSSTKGSHQCVSCPIDTFAMKPGATACDPCEPNEYAYSGSSSCSLRQPCTPDDYESTFTPCGPNIKRTKYYQWLTPKICDSSNLQLPPDEIVDCAMCNPGTYRPNGSPDCVYCPVGTVSDLGATQCTSCVAGQYAMPIYLLYRFYEWTDGLETFCNYQCGSPGWRLRDTYLDSGAGHGKFVQSVLRLSLNVTQSGRISFNYGLFCEGRCELSFTDGESISQRMVGGPTVNTPQGGWSRSYKISPGFHTFEWTFTKVDPEGIYRNDRATLYSIRVQGSQIGGGVNCTSCPAGYYGPDGKNCLPTPPGYYGVTGSISPIPCADGTFQPDYQQPSCIPCGNGTQSASDHLSCIQTCTFSPSENPQLTYNMWPLARTDEMYGPIYDTTGHVYYLNMCSKEHSNHSCFDIEGNPIPAYACQITTNGYGENLGDVIGFVSYPTNPTTGLIVQLTHGTMCPNKNGKTYQRQSRITMICDPEAGIGSPVPDGPIAEVSYCYYAFNWRSLYACPICTSDYIVTVTTECVNGTRSRIYSWKYPKMCHDGVQLPANQQLTCVNPGVVCGRGYYYDFDTNGCVEAQAGYYAPGGGDLYDTWWTMPVEFSSNTWQLQGDSIRSGSQVTNALGNNESSLITTRSFVTSGQVEFTVLVTSTNNNSSLLFLIDESLALSEIKSTNYRFSTFVVNITAGRHLLKWTFRNGDEYNAATISEIRITGLYYANEKQLKCPLGHYTSTPGHCHCTPCPRDTYAGVGATECIPCNSDQYSDVGSSTCQPRPLCKTSDYELVPSACDEVNQSTNYSFVPLNPHICLGQTPNSYSVESCQSCRIGYFKLANGTCDKCSLGEYYSSSSKTCKIADKGFKAVPQIGYFFFAESNWPSNNFETFASGEIGSNGWRVTGAQVDSGYFDNHEVESVLNLSIEMVDDGSISFDYMLDTSSPDSTLLFTIDGEHVSLKTVSSYSQGRFQSTIPLTSGKHVVSWIYHQKFNTTGRVLLSNILLIGEKNGGATELTRCSAGYHSDHSGSVSCQQCDAGTFSTGGNSECIKCPSGTYSEKSGSAECFACGAGTLSSPNRTTCTTDCIYTSANNTYDLSPLAKRNYEVELPARNSQLVFNICNKLAESVCSQSEYATYTCEINDKKGTDAGHVLSAYLTESATETIKLIYNKGSDSNCLNKLTEIILVCDLSATEDSEPVLKSESTSQCSIVIEWNSPYACPRCTDKDYELQATECIKGSQTVSEVRVGNCYGAASRNSSEKSCNSNHWLVPLVILGVALVILVVLGGAFAFVFMRHKRLENRYSLLLNETSKTTELDTM